MFVPRLVHLIETHSGRFFHGVPERIPWDEKLSRFHVVPREKIPLRAREACRDLSGRLATKQANQFIDRAIYYAARGYEGARAARAA